MKKPIYILGTSLSVNGSSCLMKDGKIVVAIEKERLTRIKHDGFNDDLTIKYCLDAEGIRMEDVSLIVEEASISTKYDYEDLKKRGIRKFPPEIPIIQISHHLAHAYSVFGVAPNKEMTVIVMDGFGSNYASCMDKNSTNVFFDSETELDDVGQDFFETESCYYWNGKFMEAVFKHFSKYKHPDRKIFPVAPIEMEHSIAGFYGGVSNYIFGRYHCEGKTMGLAPFGSKDVYQFAPFDETHRSPLLVYQNLQKFSPELINTGTPDIFWENFQYYADIAQWAQTGTESATLSFVNHCFQLTHTDTVAFSGGLMLNAVSNRNLIKNSKFKNFYFQPAAGDNGIAVGCCYYGWIEVLKKQSVFGQSAYLGQRYSDDQILTSINYNQDNISWETRPAIEEIASMIAEGKVVAWYIGGSEFGPRALGHRSILADPRREYMHKYINRSIKNREEFRPFAPSVIEEKANMYFNMLGQKSPHMILTFEMSEYYISKLSAVVHCDASARVQTVNKKDNPLYYELLNAFEKITGFPILLNTSFNGVGMPIIETPDQAIDFFINSPIDALVLDNYIIFHK